MPDRIDPLRDIDPFQERVARIALGVARDDGFVLGGGLALVAHGVLVRPTEDIDLFRDSGDDDGSGRDGAGDLSLAAGRIGTALTSAGIRAEVQPVEGWLAELVAGLDDQLVELVAYRDGTPAQVRLTLGRLHRRHGPVVLDIGPVMHLDDLRAWKVAALVARAEPRDYIDVAAFLGSMDPPTLIGLARTMDPAIGDDEVAAVGARLDRMPDREFTGYGLDAAAVAVLRRRFAAWPGR